MPPKNSRSINVFENKKAACTEYGVHIDMNISNPVAGWRLEAKLELSLTDSLTRSVAAPLSHREASPSGL